MWKQDAVLSQGGPRDAAVRFRYVANCRMASCVFFCHSTHLSLLVFTLNMTWQPTL